MWIRQSDDSMAVYLYKLHGSVLWYKSQRDWFIKVPIGLDGKNLESSEITLYDGDTASPILLYPMFKQPMESPLLDFTYILKQRLEAAKFLIVIGYSFRDDYISALFRDAFRARPHLHMISVGPDARRHHLELMKKGPSFETAFSNRVTCLPFPAEKVLTRLAQEFNAFPALIGKWHEYQSQIAIGRDALCADLIGPLSGVHETALSDILLANPTNQDRLSLETHWVVAFRNYAMATAMADPSLIASCYDRLHDLLTSIWGMFNVRVHYTNGGWQIMCDLAKPGLDGSAVQSLNFGPFMFASREVIRIIDELRHDLSRDALAEKAALDKLRDWMIPVGDLFAKLCAQHEMSREVFRDIIRPQLLEGAQDFDEWFHRLAGAPGDYAAQMTTSILRICHPVLPRAFGNLLKGLQSIGASANQLSSPS